MEGALDPIVLDDGATLAVRPVHPGDGPLLDAMVAGLSEEAARRRFFAPKHTLTRRELDYLTHIDHHSHEALLALEAPAGPVAAVARYVRDPAREGVAEASILVADAWQHRGLGEVLMRRLAQRARANGVRRFTALTLADNRPARHLFETLGPSTWRRGDPGVIVVDVDLEPSV